jgi:RHS repeat-associated protein
VVYYHTDAIGTVRAITGANGQVIARNDNLPIVEPWPPSPNADFRLFAGKERDAETGLDYFGARYYLSAIGRFTTADAAFVLSDTLQNPQRWNKYAYVSNNPMRKIDPDGRWERDVHYDLTRVLAKAVGFSGDEAAHIARIDQFTDDNPATSPMGMLPFGEAVERRARWHFTAASRRQELWSQFKSTGSLDDLGIFLHAEQDAFSHVGFSARIGQVPSFVINGTDLKAVDKTAHKPQRADAMARDTYTWLLKASGSDVRMHWSLLEPYVRRFNRALPREKERILEELERQLGDQ